MNWLTITQPTRRRVALVVALALTFAALAARFASWHEPPLPRPAHHAAFVTYSDAEYYNDWHMHERWYGPVPVGHFDLILGRGNVADVNAYLTDHPWMAAAVAALVFGAACAVIPLADIGTVLCVGAGAVSAAYFADAVHAAATKRRCLDLRWSNYGLVVNPKPSLHYPPRGSYWLNGMYRYAGDQGCHSPSFWHFAMTWTVDRGPNCWLTAYYGACGWV